MACRCAGRVSDHRHGPRRGGQPGGVQIRVPPPRLAERGGHSGAGGAELCGQPSHAGGRFFHWIQAADRVDRFRRAAGLGQSEGATDTIARENCLSLLLGLAAWNQYLLAEVMDCPLKCRYFHMVRTDASARRQCKVLRHRAQGWVETTYVDESFRIGHGDKGSIFITSKAQRKQQ